VIRVMKQRPSSQGACIRLNRYCDLSDSNEEQYSAVSSNHEFTNSLLIVFRMYSRSSAIKKCEPLRT
jgi:hypothetical protein